MYNRISQAGGTNVNRTAPWDKQKRVILKSQLQRVCLECGSFAALLPGGYRCRSCQSTNIGEVWEHDLDAFRRGLAEKKEEGEAMKSNPARSNLNLRFMSFDQLFTAAADGTLIPDGSDNTMAGSLRDAGFGEMGIG